MRFLLDFQLYKKVQDIGARLCPAVVGPPIAVAEEKNGGDGDDRLCPYPARRSSPLSSSSHFPPPHALSSSPSVGQTAVACI